MIDSLQSAWHGFLNLISGLVIPDWGALVNLLPVFLFFGVIMPILSLIVLVWLIYVLRKPRVRISFAEGPRNAPIAGDGQPVFPIGEPYCTRDRLIYPPGATRCDTCQEPLTVLCPKCSVGRAADISTCGNCGLVLKLAPRARALRPAGPPRGGAAVA